MNRNDVVSNGKITGKIVDIDFAINEIKVSYTIGTEKKFEHTGQIFSPSTGRDLWHVVRPFVAKQYSGGIVLVTEYQETLHFWQGNGRYTQDPEKAKCYEDADVAQNLCEKMRRRNFKFCILDDLVKLCNGKVVFANQLQEN